MDIELSAETLDALTDQYRRFEPVRLETFFSELDTPQKRNLANYKIGMARQVPILQDYQGIGHFWYPPEPAAAYHLQNSTPKMERLAEFVAMVVNAVDVDEIHDVGANAGLFAAFCSSLIATPITCYEPIPTLHPYIAANAPRASLRQTVLGDHASSAVAFHVNTQSLQTSALDRSAIIEDTATVSTINVTMERLDTVAVGKSVVKIDVQGAELEVLAGMSGCLDDCQALLVESTYLSLNTITDILPQTRSAGFDHLYVVNDVSFGADLLLTRVPIEACRTAAARTFAL